MSELSILTGPPLLQGGSVDAAASKGVPFATTTTSGQYGAWAELLVAEYDLAGFYLYVADNAGATPEVVVRLGVGAAGSEQVRLDSIRHYQTAHISWLYVPIGLKTGQRLAVSARGHGGSAVNLRGYALGVLRSSTGIPSYHRGTIYGVGASGGGSGTQVDPGATAHTKGSWTQITGSTGHPAKALTVFTGGHGHSGDTTNNLVDVAVGASGQERIVVANLMVKNLGFNFPIAEYHGPLPCRIPTGTRIAMRSQSDWTSSPRRVLGCAVIIWE